MERKPILQEVNEMYDVVKTARAMVDSGIIPNKIYSLEQTARVLQLTPRTVRTFIKTGKLATSKLGRQHRILGSYILDFLKRSKKRAKK